MLYGSGARKTSWYPKFNGSHFGLQLSFIHKKMTGLSGKFLWTFSSDLPIIIFLYLFLFHSLLRLLSIFLKKIGKEKNTGLVAGEEWVTTSSMCLALFSKPLSFDNFCSQPNERINRVVLRWSKTKSRSSDKTQAQNLQTVQVLEREKRSSFDVLQVIRIQLPARK